MRNTIYPCILFHNQAKEAAKFYCDVFPNTSITKENPFVSVLNANGQTFLLMNGCAATQVNPAISFFIFCKNEAQVEQTWRGLSEGGNALMPLGSYPWSEKYGWVQDQFGVNWQVMLAQPGSPEQMFVPAMMFSGTVAGLAEKAMQTYTKIFPGSNIQSITRYSAGESDVEDWVKHGQFCLGSVDLIAFDSSYPHAFGFNESVSFVVECGTQEEIDNYWSQLSQGGSEGQCGWLKDRFGVSWQIVPEVLAKLMSDPERMPRVSQAFMKMKKFDIAALENA
jgi:predicted 3-demethylubiquinone-9 3-methyltransferase (glyoxalase superfamily)